MTTATILKTYTIKDLAKMARRLGVDVGSGMRKDQLIRALVTAKRKAEKTQRKPAARPAARPSAARASSSRARSAVSRPAVSRPAVARVARVAPTRAPAKRPAPRAVASPPVVRKADRATDVRKSAPPARPAASGKRMKLKDSRVAAKIHQAHEAQENLKDLSHVATVAPAANGHKNGRAHAVPRSRPRRGGDRDRVVLIVRDPFWLQVCWEVSRRGVERARAAMAEQWHTARPTLRLLEVDDGSTSNTAERVVRDIGIHGGVSNWYIDVYQPPKSHRVDLGYLSSSGKYYSLARSNTVKTPQPGSSDAIDNNWADIAANYEKVYAMSGGYDEENDAGELRELFEERLRRPMGSPMMTGYGVGAERLLNRDRELPFNVDAEMIIYGSTKPDARVQLAGDPVKLRPDGTFTVRLSMPDRRQVLPVVASSADGVEQRTVVLAVERNTKVMEPMIREGNE